MTWRAEDLLRTGRGSERTAPARDTGPPASASAPAPVVLDDAGVPMLPTVAAGLSWGEDDTGEERWTQDMERELLVEGFVAPQTWDLWAKICRRGVTEM